MLARIALMFLTMVLASLVPLGAEAQVEPRSSAATGYRIADHAIWDYFRQRGGEAFFGAPISREF